MPESGVENHGHQNTLRYEAYLEIIEALVPLGLEKIRITGGEPLVRKGVVDLVRGIKAIDGVSTLVMTTNGELLESYALALKEAGLDRVNISLDAVEATCYAAITRGGDVNQALKGIEAAVKAGLVPVKLNMVYIKGVNDHQLKPLMALTGDQVMLRLIELMPIGEASTWSRDHFEAVQPVLDATEALIRVPYADSGVAKYYKNLETGGLVGAITPISDHFCHSCDKIRITSDGLLRTCLHSDSEVDLKPYIGQNDGGRGIREIVLGALQQKPKHHKLGESNQAVKRNMFSMGG